MTSKTTPASIEETLKSIKSFDDVNTNVVEYSEEFGSEFERLGFERLSSADKARLVGVPFVILAYKFSDGKIESKPLVSVAVITNENNKFVFTDGGTGIMNQCREMEARGVTSDVMCSKGLRRSEYMYVDDDGVKSPAVTYYLA